MHPFCFQRCIFYDTISEKYNKITLYSTISIHYNLTLIYFSMIALFHGVLCIEYSWIYLKEDSYDVQFFYSIKVMSAFIPGGGGLHLKKVNLKKILEREKRRKWRNKIEENLINHNIVTNRYKMMLFFLCFCFVLFCFFWGGGEVTL